MKRVRTIAAWILLIGSVIMWPVSQLTFARNEPPLTLGLSWLAITLVAADLLTTSQQAEKSDD
jgi:hypothetical protein